MKRILINATQQEELRVAIVDGQKLYDLDIEVPSREQKKSSVFKGTITRIEPSLEAAFVDYGAERHGFLPFKEIVRDYWCEEAQNASRRPGIKEAVKEGQQLIVQVEKEERGNKGAALTTKVSLAGRYLVLMPTEPRAGGVSRRIEGDERSQVREAMRDLEMPEGMGCIIRTAGVGRTTEELQWDLDYLITLWKAIDSASTGRDAPFLIYHDSSVVIRALRDHYSSDIGEIIIDSPEVYKRAEEFIQQVMPHNQRKLKMYQEKVPLFSRFQIESQIESAFHRTVSLPSGGAIVIDHTEALISIDVNSARATKGGDIEETALNTNLEAAEEIGRQLRLRDLGGLLVVDFIDMIPNRNQREVENRLREVLKYDRARVQVGRISRFGLLEMSRQRLRPSLGESSQEVCPHCSGHGIIRSVESTALSILRLLEEEAMKENTGRVLAHLPVDVATFLLNEKRSQVDSIEKRHNIHILLVPDHNYERPNHKLERIRNDDEEHAALGTPTFELVEKSEPTLYTNSSEQHQVQLSEQAAVQSVTVPKPPSPHQPSTPGIVTRLWNSLFGGVGGSASHTHSGDNKSESSDTPKKNAENKRKPPARKRKQPGSRDAQNNNQQPRGKKTRQTAEQKNSPSKKHDKDKSQEKSTNNKQDKGKSPEQENNKERGQSSRSRRRRPSRNNRDNTRQQETATTNSHEMAEKDKVASNNPAAAPVQGKAGAPDTPESSVENSGKNEQVQKRPTKEPRSPSPRRAQTSQKKSSAREDKPAEPPMSTANGNDTATGQNEQVTQGRPTKTRRSVRRRSRTMRATGGGPNRNPVTPSTEPESNKPTSQTVSEVAKTEKPASATSQPEQTVAKDLVQPEASSQATPVNVAEAKSPAAEKTAASDSQAKPQDLPASNASTPETGSAEKSADTAAKKVEKLESAEKPATEPDADEKQPTEKKAAKPKRRAVKKKATTKRRPAARKSRVTKKSDKPDSPTEATQLSSSKPESTARNSQDTAAKAISSEKAAETPSVKVPEKVSEKSVSENSAAKTAKTSDNSVTKAAAANDATAKTDAAPDKAVKAKPVAEKATTGSDSGKPVQASAAAVEKPDTAAKPATVAEQKEAVKAVE